MSLSKWAFLLNRDGTLLARHRVTVVNQGNAPELLTLDASDPNEALAFKFPEEQFAVEPGETRVVDLGVRPRRMHWFGQPTPHPFTVTAKTADDNDHKPAGTLVVNIEETR